MGDLNVDTIVFGATHLPILGQEIPCEDIQMVMVFKSLALGLRPDNPSEKDIITRVVKGVKIYNHKRLKNQTEA